MYNISSILNFYDIWCIPIISILLTLIISIISTPDNEHLSLKDLLNIGVNLCISAITIIINNDIFEYYSSINLLFILVILILATIIRKFLWNKNNSHKIVSCILFIVLGILFNILAIIQSGNHPVFYYL